MTLIHQQDHQQSSINQEIHAGPSWIVPGSASTTDHRPADQLNPFTYKFALDNSAGVMTDWTPRALRMCREVQDTSVCFLNEPLQKAKQDSASMSMMVHLWLRNCHQVESTTIRYWSQAEPLPYSRVQWLQEKLQNLFSDQWYEATPSPNRELISHTRRTLNR